MRAPRAALGGTAITCENETLLQLYTFFTASRRVTNQGGGGRLNRHGEAARKRPQVLREDREHSFARGTRHPRRGTATGKEAELKAETEKARPGLTMLIDGSRLGDRAAS